MQKDFMVPRKDFSFGKLAKTDTGILRPPGPHSVSTSGLTSSQPAWLCNPSAVRVSPSVPTEGNTLGFEPTNPDVHPRNWPERLKEWLRGLAGCE